MGNVAATAGVHYLKPHEAAELIGVHKHTLARWRIEGVGPEWIKVSRNVVRYERAALDRYLTARSSAAVN